MANIKDTTATCERRRAKIVNMGLGYQDTTAQRIKWARNRAGLTQDGLAREVGVLYVYINQIENAKREPSRKLLKKIAAVLEVSLGFLELETDDPTPPKQQDDNGNDPVYFSPEADEIARMVDAMPEHRRAYILNMVRLSFAHGELMDAGVPATGTQGANSILREVVQGIDKHGSA